MARTARREVIGLLIEQQVIYTEVEADALISEAKRLAKESGRTVRAEAERLLSRDRQTRLQDLRDKVVEVRDLLAAISVEVDDIRAESGDDDGELAVIMATMTAACEPFTAVPADGAASATTPGRPVALSVAARHGRSEMPRAPVPESAGGTTLAGSSPDERLATDPGAPTQPPGGA